ncbi:MAG: glycosyltransferase [Candidatus Dormibacteria bacterium]
MDRAYFDIDSLGLHDSEIDRRHATADFLDLVERVAAVYYERLNRRPRRLLLLGRWHIDFVSALSGSIAVELAPKYAVDETQLVTRPLVETVGADLATFDIILMNELLEAVHRPTFVLDGLANALHANALVAVAFANMDALPTRALRRRWKSFFDKRVAFYDADNMQMLMWRLGFRRAGSKRLRTTYSVGYLANRLALSPHAQHRLAVSGLAKLSGRVASGREVIVFHPVQQPSRERLSIVVPVYNEERYVGDVLTGVLDKPLPIEREVIVVESGSTDGSRAIVHSFEGSPGVQVIYQDSPRGKGDAVRAALERASGTIILIQDADFEYDIDDYDALLEPILQRRANFVLGSRSLGLDDWKVRQYGASRTKGFAMNLAQVLFARTFNILYQQKTTDINTMLKVFRRECIAGCHLKGSGFNFDIELVCKIVRNGFEPLEVPVNYVARGFDEGKKINFILDAYPSYYQLFRCRFGRL